MIAHGRLAQPSSLDAPGNPPVLVAQAKVAAVGPRAGFTLVELLITVSVIAIMATMVLFALFAAQETAKVHKTKSLIAKLDSIIKAKYETYNTRRVPITVPPGTDPQTAARMRLDGLRELMRMELPERWSDIAVVDPSTLKVRTNTTSTPPNPFGSATPISGISSPSVWQGYFRRVHAANQANPDFPSLDFQGAECLYMIVMNAQQDEADDRSAIRPDSIGDVDSDGFPEFIDAWGQPIRFLRWAPGFVSELQTTLNVASASATATLITAQNTPPNKVLSNDAGSYVGGAIINEDPMNPGRYLPTSMARITGYTYDTGTLTGSFDVTDLAGTFIPPVRFFVTAPDPFDPRGVYPIASQSTPTFALYPLIYSAGPNKCYGVVSDTVSSDPNQPLHYNAPIPNLMPPDANVNHINPFYLPTNGDTMGMQKDLTGEPNFVPNGWVDNIHNHMITAR